MKIKKQHMILLGVIAALLIYLLLGTGKNKMSYAVPRLKNLDQMEITRIEITGKERSVTLVGQEKNWTILPQKFPADPVKVEDMLETISGLSLTELAAEKEDYQRYDLDQDNRLNIKAFQEETLVREFDIGKIPSTYRHTFVRMAEDTRVFYARDSFRSRFDLEVKDLRDKSVLGFDKNEISEISITQAGSTLVFTKKMVVKEPDPGTPVTQEGQEAEATEPKAPSQEEEAWVSSEGKTGLKASFDTILSELSDLRCDEYLEEENPAENQEPVIRVTLKGTKDYTLSIFAKQEGDNGKYPALSSENAFPFLLSTYGAERIIKKPNALFPEEQENQPSPLSP